MKENIALYSKTIFLDVDELFGVGDAKNLHVWTDLESRWQRQKDECFPKNQEAVWKLEDDKKNLNLN